MRAPVTVVGVADDRFEALSFEARDALAGAGAVAGSRRHLELWRSWPVSAATQVETLEISGDSTLVAAAVRRWAIDQHRDVCVLASGDPGFFGIVRALLGALDRRALRVLPALSAVSVAFARLALPWDDAVVVPTDGRHRADVVTAARTARKAAVLSSPDAPPEALGMSLIEAGAVMDLVAVCERLGSADESVRELTLEELAGGRFDPHSVVVLVGPGRLPLVGWEPGAGNVLAWAAGRNDAGATGAAWNESGATDAGWSDAGNTATGAEVRAIALARLALPVSGVLWHVGAGAGALAVECALARPALTVFAVEGRAATAARISAAAVARGAAVHVVPAWAPAALGPLPAPDRAFVGGGGLEVLDAVLGRLRPGGRAVVACTTLDRAVGAADRLGNLVELSVGRGEQPPDRGWRLATRGPVFLAWGPA